MRSFIVLTCLLSSTFAFAGDLSIDDLANINREREKGRAAIAKKYGDKPTGAERREMVKEQQASDKAVLEKAGVDQATYVRASARANGNDVNGAMKAQDEAAKKKAAGTATPAPAAAEGAGGNSQADKDAAEAAEADKAMKKK